MRHLLLWIVLATAVAACGSSSEPTGTSSPTAITIEPQLEGTGHVEVGPGPDSSLGQALPTQASSGCVEGDRQDLRTPRVAYAAYVEERAEVAARPGGKRLIDLGPKTQNGFPMVLGVLEALLDSDCEPAWYHVQLAKRPNGSTGYVAADAVVLRRIDVRIEIDLSERTLELIRDGKPVFGTTAAIGSDITPTPTGHYFVNERWIVNDSWGSFGPRALGISAYSPVLEDWVQGGPIGIHGTNQPSSVGQAASHGCIRLKNEAMLLLFSKAPAGTPVNIRA